MTCLSVKNKYLKAVCETGCYILRNSMEELVFVMYFGDDKISSNLFTRND